MKALVFQHTPEERPGTLLDWFRDRGIQHMVHPWYAGAPVPPEASFDRLVVLGGPMNVDQEKEFPWLRDEKKFLRDWLAAEKPVLGICLGGQLLSQALGGRVTRNPEREIGFHEVRKTGESHPALARWPSALQVYQYHEDTFSLPPGAVRLLESPACPNQAFAVGSRVLGLQFHPESTAEWIQGNAKSIRRADGERWVQTPAEAEGLMQKLLPPLTQSFHGLLGEFFK